MSLIKLSVRRSVTVAMAFIALIVFSGVSLSKLNIDLFPEISMPMALVMATYDGAGPQEVEAMVTRPLEAALGGVQGLTDISSQSSFGSSMIMLTMTQKTDMDYATLDIREKVDLIKDYLPDGVRNITVLKLDVNMMPVVMLGVTGGRDLAEIKQLTEDLIIPRVERVEGVASVSLSGGYDREIQVIVDPAALDAYGLSLSQISGFIAGDNLNFSVGSVDEGGKTLSLRLLGEYTDISQLRDLPIPLAGGGMIYLRDIARVEDTISEQNQLSRINGVPGLSLMVMKQSDANTVLVSNAVYRELDKLSENLPESVEVVKFFSQADYIELMIAQLRDNAVLGAILAVVVLFLFLWDWRLTLIVGVSIPLSLVGAFTLLYLNGLTLNLMTLGGLALGAGMMVDCSIIILENITRYREEGLEAKAASIRGASELSMAVIASTLTTIAVFLPIVFTEGLASMFFKDFALTVAFSLLASLVVSLTLVPMISSKIKGLEKPMQSWAFLNRIKDWVLGAQERINQAYGELLGKALKRKKVTILLVLLALLASVAAVPFVNMELMPPFDQGQISISIQMPDGSSLEESDAAAQEAERIIEALGDEVESSFVAVGGGNVYSLGAAGSESATIDLVLSPHGTRRSAGEIGDVLRKELAAIPGAEVSVNSGEVSITGGADLSYTIKGEDFETLGLLSEELKTLIEGVEGTREVVSSIEEGRPEMEIKINRSKAMQYGLTTYQVANAAKGAMTGEVATRYREAGQEMDVKVMLPEESANNLAQVEQLRIATPMGFSVPLAELADFQVVQGPVSITRQNNARMVTVTASTAGRALGTIAQEIDELLPTLTLPQGYIIETGGSVEEMAESFSDLFLALLLAVCLVYLILASLYESLVHPFIIMFTLPTSFIGVVLALILTGNTLNISTFIGIIMLAGIVVNNGIVLVDSINLLRSEGMEMDAAIKKAGSLRLRPVLMTSLTTILAMLPIAFGRGEGSELSAPMSVALIGGLTASTFFTLVLVPVIYAIVSCWKGIFGLRDRRAAKKQGAEGQG